MGLPIDLKDLIYITVNVASVTALFVMFRARISNMERSQTECKLENDKKLAELKTEYASLKGMIISESGKLHYIDHDSCKKYQDHIYTAIRNGKDQDARALDMISKLHDNVNKIMFQLKIDTE